jgi:hypothetical protein
MMRQHNVGMCVAALLLLLMAGCTGSETSKLGPPASTLPPCANAGTPISLPSEFPDNFPLPPGTVVTASQRSAAGPITITASIPTDFKRAVAFFQTTLPAAGYQLLEGDAEMDEAESTFAGQGFRGKWKINGILNCPGAVRLTLAIARA